MWLAVPWLGATLYLGVGLAPALGARLAAVLGGLMALLALPPLWAGWRRLRTQEPVVSISRFGLHDRRLTRRLIPWQDIAAVHLGTYGDEQALLLDFRDLGVALQHVRRGQLGPTLAERGWGSRDQVGVVLGPLQCRHADVLALCQRHLKRVHADALTAAAAADSGP